MNRNICIASLGIFEELLLNCLNCTVVSSSLSSVGCRSLFISLMFTNPVISLKNISGLKESSGGLFGLNPKINAKT